MSTDLKMDQLRHELTTHLDWLQELTMRRNMLLHLAAADPRPSVARALRCNRLLAERTRRAARLARAQLGALETNGNAPAGDGRLHAIRA